MSLKVPKRLIMTAEDIERTIHRMAYQIWERNAGGDLAIVGIHTRGVTLAKRLQPLIENFSGQEIPLGKLDIAMYRDDIGLTSIAPEVRNTEIPFNIDDKDIILVDDVLFTGRTIRAALNALMDLGRPRRVELLVLIDRGHRELPIQADFIGKEIDTYLSEKVVVSLYENDNHDEVYVVTES